jgi:SurA N-terminal domain
MIGSIRKHSKWLWIVIAGLTIISFVVFMGQGPMRNGSGRTSGGYGTIYGQAVTAPDYAKAQGEFYLYYWLHDGRWPDKAGVAREEQQKEIYIRLLLHAKAQQLGITIGDDALVAAANDFLRSLGRNGQPLQMQKFVEQVLAPEGLSVLDLQNFLRDELIVQQMVQTLGLPGALVTPQEAGLIYDRENQEISAQAVFFAASNYLSQVTVTPAAVAQFYTNNLAVYREPDRVQVSYVFFDVTNYLAQAKAEWEKTNFTEYVNAVYAQYGQSQFPDAKTPDEAKARIRDLLIHDRALRTVRQVANDFGAALFAMDPVKPENLAAAAQQKGLLVRTTAPFNANFGPEEFSAPAGFTKAAFQLTADAPFAGPIIGQDGAYIIALAGQLPSAIPPLSQIINRVTEDFRQQSAIALAQRAGTNAYYNLTVQMAAGNSFGKAAVAAGQVSQVLPAFSLSTQELPELGDHATLNQIKQAAFTTSAGRVSNFIPDRDGGFVLFVQQQLPVDQAKKAAERPQFTARVQRARQGEAFNLWLMAEANRELRDTPVYASPAGGTAK